MLMRRMRTDKRGLTLIELVIAAAILGIITATVGGALVVATNAYRNGTMQSAMQTEAQFTVNAIEGLIIDATNTVEVSGNLLTIANVDYTYYIKFVPGTPGKLLYWQTETSSPGSLPSDDDAWHLLAEHVSNFIVNADNFPTARNVQLTITMENGGRSYTTSYNITSRNNPDAGEALVMTANITVPPELILEPNEVYPLPVVITGPANKEFTVTLEPEGDHTAQVTIDNYDYVNGTVNITIGTDETGGADALLRFTVSTKAKDASGHALAEEPVVVRIRRVLSMDIDATCTLKSGNAAKQNAEYSVNAEPVGTNFDKGVGSYDDIYFDPRLMRWSFETSTGEDGNNYAEILDGTGESSQLSFRLKQDLPLGMVLKIKATAKHPQGLIGTEQTNKSRQVYGDVYAYVTLEATEGPGGLHLVDSQLRRGDECYVESELDPQKLVEEEWKRNHPGEEQPWPDRYNAGFTGNIYFRYVAMDGSHSSEGHPGWIKMKEQGNNPTNFKFNAADFEGMYFMKDYTIEILYSFRYNTGNNQLRYYPACAFPDGNGDHPIPDVDPQYIYTFPMYAFAMGFEEYADGNTWPQQGHSCEPYATANGCGLGTFSRPMEVAYGNEMNLKFNIFTGATAEKGGTLESLLQYAKLYKWNGSGWSSNSLEIQYTDRHDKQFGTIKLGLQNAQIQKDVVYKLVFEQVKGPKIKNEYGQEVQVIETYAYEPVDGFGGRGVLYLKFK